MKEQRHQDKELWTLQGAACISHSLQLIVSVLQSLRNSKPSPGILSLITTHVPWRVSKKNFWDIWGISSGEGWRAHLSCHHLPPKGRNEYLADRFLNSSSHSPHYSILCYRSSGTSYSRLYSSDPASSSLSGDIYQFQFITAPASKQQLLHFQHSYGLWIHIFCADSAHFKTYVSQCCTQSVVGHAVHVWKMSV